MGGGSYSSGGSSSYNGTSVQRAGSPTEGRYLSGGQSSYNNGVQITTSRITTERGEQSGGQVNVRQPEASYSSSGQREVIGSNGTRRYQFHEKKYERTTRE